MTTQANIPADFYTSECAHCCALMQLPIDRALWICEIEHWVDNKRASRSISAHGCGSEAWESCYDLPAGHVAMVTGPYCAKCADCGN